MDLRVGRVSEDFFLLSDLSRPAGGGLTPGSLKKTAGTAASCWLQKGGSAALCLVSFIAAKFLKLSWLVEGNGREARRACLVHLLILLLLFIHPFTGSRASWCFIQGCSGCSMRAGRSSRQGVLAAFACGSRSTPPAFGSAGRSRHGFA